MEDGCSGYGTTCVSKETVDYIEGKKTGGCGNSDIEDGMNFRM